MPTRVLDDYTNSKLFAMIFFKFQSFSFAEAVKKFHEKNGGRFPETVIVYRDGVGDGQLDMVLEQEIPQFKAAFTEAGKPE